MYFIRHKSDAAKLFQQSLADYRANSVPFTVVIVRSDRGDESRKGKFGGLCRSRGIKQKFKTADSPELNGVAEGALMLIETTARAGRISPKSFFPARNSRPLRRCGRNQRANRHMRCGIVAPPQDITTSLAPTRRGGERRHRRNHKSVLTLTLHPTTPETQYEY